eukprot:CAMPEP_0176119716 /NCGR_PEP_ID=MMETSP0120_2-20121206/60198_1 /TAXON_ID=160619 /ORGANISM="Kryptoperidinium foliaceum, Strain CCMP 1326" /LENGTH=69 /DNA_ID=CAMNT_0017454129 /DNA_START=134 /DNA_END=343 /DNA_ORIENTATION=+
MSGVRPGSKLGMPACARSIRRTIMSPPALPIICLKASGASPAADAVITDRFITPHLRRLINDDSSGSPN